MDRSVVVVFSKGLSSGLAVRVAMGFCVALLALGVSSVSVADATTAHPSDTPSPCNLNNEYGSWSVLQGAVNALGSTSPATVFCLSGSITESGDSLALAAGTNVTLDLNGYDLTIANPPTGDAAINVPGTATLTIQDSSAGATGSLTVTGGSGSGGGAGIGGNGGSSGSGQDAGTINIESGTVTANGGTGNQGGGAGIGGGGGGITYGAGNSGAANGGGSGTVTIGGGTITADGGNSCFGGGGAGIGGGGGGNSYSASGDSGAANGGGSGVVTVASSTITTPTGGHGYEGGGAGIGGGGGGYSFSYSGGDSGAANGGGSGVVTVASSTITAPTGGDGYEGGGAGIGGGGGGYSYSVSGDSGAANGGGSGVVTVASSTITAPTGGDGHEGGGGAGAGIGGGGGYGYGGDSVAGAGGSLEVQASPTGPSELSGLVAAALMVDSGASLTVPTGQTLSYESSAAASNAGRIVVAGTLNGSNTITNTGVILPASGSSIPGDGNGGSNQVLITGYAYALSSGLNVSGLPAALQGSVSWTDGTPDTDPDMVYVFAPTLADAGVSLPAITIPSPATYGFYTNTSAGTLVDANTDLSQVIGTASSAGTVSQDLYAQYANLPQTLTVDGLGLAGTVGGSATFTASTTGGSNQPIDVSVDAGSQPSNACTLTQTGSGWSVSYQHAGSCMIDANQAASSDGLWAAATQLSQTITIAPASTSISVAVGSGSVTATVSSSAGTPDGSVQFFLNGALIGTAPLIDGVATLSYTVPADQAQQIAAAFTGNDDFTASSNTTTTTGPSSGSGPGTGSGTEPGSGTGTGTGSGTTTTGTSPGTGTSSTPPLSPSITATITSAAPKNAAGWYRTPVTITFTCTTAGSPLASPCPAAITLSRSGAGQSISRTITTQNGGIATVVVSPIDIELPAAIRVQAAGIVASRYYTTSPRLRCDARALSAIKTCEIHTRTSTQPGSILNTTHYTITTTTTAGNQRVTDGSYQQLNTYLIGASYRNGAFHISTGRAYTLIVTDTKTRPRYIYAAPTPVTPTGGNIQLHPAGKDRWTLTIYLNHPLTNHYHNWTLGINVNNQLRKLQITNN